MKTKTNMSLPQEKQVCSLTLAMRLKELGVPQESLFYWHTNDMERKNECYQVAMSSESVGFYYPKEYSAFTVAELGEMLPVRALSGRRKKYKDGKPVWYCNYSHKNGEMTYQQNADTEADARAKCLIYLIENGIIKA